MKKKMRRPIAFLMAIFMLVSLMPITASAAPGNGSQNQGLPIFLFVAQPGTTPTPTSNNYEDYPGYTQGAYISTPDAKELDGIGVRNPSSEEEVTRYFADLTDEEIAELEDFGTFTAWRNTYDSDYYDIVWIAASRKEGWGAGGDEQCYCRVNYDHIHIDAILSERVDFSEELNVSKTIPAPQDEDETFDFILEKLVLRENADDSYTPLDQADPNFEPLDLTATIPAGETKAAIVGGEHVEGTFGYYRITEVENEKWTPRNVIYFDIATNGDIKYSYTLDPDNFVDMDDATISNDYRTYTVTYEDGFDNVNIFNTQSYVDLMYGVDTPPFRGSTPMYPDNLMTFTGWSPAIASTVTENVTYVAQWRDNAYTVTWLEDDGTELEVDEDVTNGTVPTYDGEAPSKTADAQYTYVFAGWTPAITAVDNSDQTYTAVYTPVVNTYTVTWLDSDGVTVLEKDENVEYHVFPTYDNTSGRPSELAAAKSDEQYVYTFTGWTPVPAVVTGNQEYVATYSRALRTYTVTWVNYNGAELEVDTNVAYGADPEYNGNTPRRAATTTHSYTFAGWTPEISPVTGNVTYTATYESEQIYFKGTVNVYLDSELIDGTVDLDDLLGNGAKLYLNADEGEDTETYFELTQESGKPYAFSNASLPNGEYRIYAKGGNYDEYTEVCHQLLDIENDDRVRELYFSSVTYDANGGDFDGAEVEYYHEGSTVVVSLEDIVYEGHIFMGWKDDVDETVYNPGNVVTTNITSPYVLVAQWEETINVNVIVNIDHGEDTNIDGRSDVTFQLMYHNGVNNVPVGTAVTLTADSHDGYTMSALDDKTSYAPTDYSFTDLRPGTYTVGASKSGYNTTISHELGQDGTQTIVVNMVYNPDIFDLKFDVIIDEDVPEQLRPIAANVKVLYWGYDDSGVLGWNTVPSQAGVEAPVTVNIDPATGKGTGTYSVWQHWSDTDDYAYEYRVEVVSFIAADNVVVPADDAASPYVVYTSRSGITVGTVSIEGSGGRLPAHPADASEVEENHLAGAYYNGTAQDGVPTVTVTINYGSVTFDPNGGKVKDLIDPDAEWSDEPIKLDELVRVPSILRYGPEKDGGYVFDGYIWYLDANGNGTVDEDESTPVDALAYNTAIKDDYILVAEWLDPLTIEGTVTVTGKYTLSDGEHDINDADRINKVTVLLQQANEGTTHFVTMHSAVVEIVYDADDMGSGTFRFTEVPDSGTWRIEVLNHNYTAAYQNEPNSLDAANLTDADKYATADNTTDSASVAKDTDSDDTAVVNVYMAFVPADFDLWYEVIATAIGEGYRPTEAEVLVLYDDMSTNPDGSEKSPRDWAVISQMLFDNGTGETQVGEDAALAQNGDYYGSGIKTYPVWVYHPLGHYYDYAVKLNSVDGNSDIEALPFTVNYNGSARYLKNESDPNGMQQTQLLTVTLLPKTYPITYYLEEGSTVVLNGIRPNIHTWSFDTSLENAVPVRNGYVFKGWVNADGDPVTEIDASVAEETKLYATWYVDSWKDSDVTPDPDDKDSPTEGDGIPDYKQVHILYNTDVNGVTSPIGEIYTIDGDVFTDISFTATQGSTAAPATGYAFDKWSYIDNTDDTNETVILNVVGTKLTPTIENADGGKTYTMFASFGEDHKGGENGGDGVPDKYQAFVEFHSANVNHGTVTGTTHQTFTFTDREGNYTESGSVTVDLTKITVTPAEKYAFDYWAKDHESAKLSNEDVAKTIENVAGGTTIVYNANFDIDEWTDDPDGDKDDEGDGIPDNRQVLVEFVAAANGRGTVTGEGIAQVFTLTENNGAYVGSVTPVNTDDTPVIINPNEGYAFDFWGDTDNFWKNGHGAETKDPFVEHANVVGGQIIVYTAHFGIDNWNDEDNEPTGGDGVSDNRQVLIEYVSANEEMGTVSPNVEIVTLQEKGPETVNAAGATAAAREAVVFERWYYTQRGIVVYDQNSETIAPKLENAMGGETYRFIAAFAKDEIGPDNEPDGVADYKQAVIRFTADSSGYVMGDTYQVFTLTETNGAYIGTVTPEKVSGEPYSENFEFSHWTLDDGTDSVNPFVEQQVMGGEEYVYTAQFVRAPHIEPEIEYGDVVLEKVDSEDHNTTLSDVEFALYTEQGHLVDRYITDKNGLIIVEELYEGEYYFLELRPAEGYTLDSSKHSFEITAGMTTELTVENERTAVPEVFSGDHYAYIIGFDDGNVHPEANITRAQVATIFFRLLSEDVRTEYLETANSFSDVDETMWFNTAVSTMAAMGIVNGRPDGTFGPNDNITRAEFAAIAARFETAGNTTNASFDDIYEHWATKEINIAANNGWILGYEDGTFKPDQRITRAEAMALVNRVLQRIPENENDLLADMVTWPDNMDTTKWYYLTVQEATNSHDYKRKTNGYEYWTDLTENPDWTVWEKTEEEK